jgi:hypothetical protein
VLPAGPTDLAALTNVGRRELDRSRQSSETPKATWRRGQQCRAARPRLSTCTVHRPIPVRANPITLDCNQCHGGRESATAECIEFITLTAAGESPGLAISAKRRIDPVLTRRIGDPVRANKDVAIHHRLLNARCGSRPIWIGALGTTSAYCKLEQDASRARSEVPEHDPVAAEKPNSLSYRRVDDHGEGCRPVPTPWWRSVWRSHAPGGRPASLGWAL